MRPVSVLRPCQWERQTLPVDHACIGFGAPPCPTEAGDPCGFCPVDLAAQVADLIQYGQPEDLVAPDA
jgi:hypothetical protein